MASQVPPTTNLLKSGIITNLDATPIVRATAGMGAAGVLMRVAGTVTPATSQATTDLIRLVRVPSNAIIQRVSMIFDTAPTTVIGDVGVWYSDATSDGTNVANAGLLAPISSAFFASTLTMSTFTYLVGTDPSNTVGLSAPVDITFANTTNANSVTDGIYIPSQSVYPLWLAMATSIALQATPLSTSPFVVTGQQPHFNTQAASSSASWVRSDDPGGMFDICLKFTTTGSTANKVLTCIVDYINPGV